GSSTVRHNVSDVGSTIGCSTGNQAHNGAAHIGVVLNGYLRHVRNEITSTTSWCRTVSVDDGFAAIEFVEYRLEGWIAQPLVRKIAQQSDTGSLQGIKGIFDFAQAGIDIGKR